MHSTEFEMHRVAFGFAFLLTYILHTQTQKHKCKPERKQGRWVGRLVVFSFCYFVYLVIRSKTVALENWSKFHIALYTVYINSCAYSNASRIPILEEHLKRYISMTPFPWQVHDVGARFLHIPKYFFMLCLSIKIPRKLSMKFEYSSPIIILYNSYSET